MPMIGNFANHLPGVFILFYFVKPVNPFGFELFIVTGFRFYLGAHNQVGIHGIPPV